MYKVPSGISNKHLHLCQADLEILFGKGYELTCKKKLKQPGQFACEETVDLIGPKNTLKRVRILGPTRKETQVELAFTDARVLGISVPVRESGKLEGTPGGLTLVGPNGSVELDHGVIAAQRHVHLSEEEAAEAGVVDKQIIRVKVEGERAVIFDNVLVRAGKSHAAEFHVDTDEGNAAGIGNDVLCELLP